MSPRHFIDELRGTLQSADLSKWEAPQLELIKQFMQLCRDAGRRLSQCESLLQKNLQSEALQLAQAEPDLLDLVTMLDIPEREILEQVCLSQKIATPPALNLSTAQALEQAYLKVQPLEELLKKHRLLALARAPLPKRRELLQVIARIDHENPIWEDDLKSWEAEIIKHVQEKLRSNRFLNDADEVLKYADVLNDGQWLIVPPPKLIEALENARKTAEQVKARQTFLALKDQLQEAFLTKNLAQARDLREQWRVTAMAAGLAFRDSITQHVADAFNWLDAVEAAEKLREEQQNALAQLNKALEVGAVVELVEDRWKAYLATGAKPSAQMTERYQRHVSRRLELREDRRKLTWVMVGVGATVVLVVGALIVLQVRHLSQLSQSTAALQYYLKENQLEEFRGYYERLLRDHGDLVREPVVDEIYHQFRQRMDAIERKSQEIVDALAALNTAPESEREPDSALKASALLGQASAAETDQLQRGLAAHAAKYSRWTVSERQKLAADVEGFQQVVKDWAGRVDLPPADLEKRREQVEDLKQRLKQSPLSDAERNTLGMQILQFDVRLTEWQQRLSDHRATDLLAVALTSALGPPQKSVDKYSQAIRDFVSQHPKHPLQAI
jgi:hypothetical protein